MWRLFTFCLFAALLIVVKSSDSYRDKVDTFDRDLVESRIKTFADPLMISFLCDGAAAASSTTAELDCKNAQDFIDQQPLEVAKLIGGSRLDWDSRRATILFEGLRKLVSEDPSYKRINFRKLPKYGASGLGLQDFYNIFVDATCGEYVAKLADVFEPLVLKVRSVESLDLLERKSDVDMLHSFKYYTFCKRVEANSYFIWNELANCRL